MKPLTDVTLLKARYDIVMDVVSYFKMNNRQSYSKREETNLSIPKDLKTCIF